jgi:hypothetical protein
VLTGLSKRVQSLPINQIPSTILAHLARSFPSFEVELMSHFDKTKQAIIRIRDLALNSLKTGLIAEAIMFFNTVYPYIVDQKELTASEIESLIQLARKSELEFQVVNMCLTQNIMLVNDFIFSDIFYPQVLTFDLTPTL